MVSLGGVFHGDMSDGFFRLTLSTMEAEYIAATKASKEMIWLQRFMEELGNVEIL